MANKYKLKENNNQFKNNTIMKLIKLNLAVVSFSSLVLLLLLLWNEDSVTCGMFTCHLFETMFAIVAVFTAVECVKIKNKHNLIDITKR